MTVVVYIPSKNMSKEKIIKRMTTLADEYEIPVIYDGDNIHLKVKPKNVTNSNIQYSPLKIPKILQISNVKTSNGQVNINISITGHFIERPHPLFGKTYVFGAFSLMNLTKKHKR